MTPRIRMAAVNRGIAACERCPRLRQHCRQIARVKRAAYRDQAYHGKPVLNFGDAEARVLVVGLAPGAHGANRTGRMFTGDRSGDFLYRAMHEAGLATQATSTHQGDGLRLRGAIITAAAHCAPPGNKPTREELGHCADWLDQTIAALPRLKVIVALGSLAHTSVLRHYQRRGLVRRLSDYPCSHGAEHAIANASTSVVALCSYHPSQQNTFTGKLTRAMLRRVFRRAATLARS